MMADFITSFGEKVNLWTCFLVFIIISIYAYGMNKKRYQSIKY